MGLFKAVIKGAASTAAISLFNRWNSKDKSDRFTEQEMTGGMLHGKTQRENLSEEFGKLDGWAAHLSSGAAVNVLYHLLMKRTKLPANILTGAALGAATGLISVALWKRTFDEKNNLPDIDRAHFLKEAFLSQVVFGITSALGTKSKKSNI